MGDINALKCPIGQIARIDGDRVACIQLSVLENDPALSQLLETMNWIVEQDRRAAVPPPLTA
jgi:hypothetical protein